MANVPPGRLQPWVHVHCHEPWGVSISSYVDYIEDATATGNNTPLGPVRSTSLAKVDLIRRRKWFILIQSFSILNRRRLVNLRATFA